MSLFYEFAEAGRLYTVTDSDSTKRASFNLAGSYDAITKIVVIRPNAIETAVLGDEMIDGVANIETTATVKEGQIVYGETSKQGYKIVNKPRYNRLFKRWRVNLLAVDVTVS